MGNELHALSIVTEEKMSNINDKIQKLINENDICLFMKGTADSPQCGFSMTVSNILKHLKLNLKE